jgi:hypothetical protein
MVTRSSSLFNSSVEHSTLTSMLVHGIAHSRQKGQVLDFNVLKAQWIIHIPLLNCTPELLYLETVELIVERE